MEVLLQSQGISRESLEAQFPSGFSPAGFQGSISMVNLDEICGHTLDQPMCRSLDVDETIDEDIEEASLRRPEKKRRLPTDQVQFLERCFELNNKLEHERKTQLAKELGLQPRQVAIWFQNRRARWKTKMLEKDYEALKSSYDRLMADHEQLVKEKEKLKAEVTVLTGKFLLREKKGKPETTELNKVVIKEEDGRSGDSVVFDAESFNCIGEGLSPLLDPSISSNTFDPDQSELSHAEDGEVKDCSLLRLEETTHNSCNYEFPAEDLALWFWSY